MAHVTLKVIMLVMYTNENLTNFQINSTQNGKVRRHPAAVSDEGGHQNLNWGM